MVFIPKKYKDIFEDMRGRDNVVTDFEVGSVARTMYETFSYELALLYEKMELVYLSAYVDTATGNQLDQVVAVLGITRSLPDFAEGEVTFLRDSGGEDIPIPLGTLVATEDSPELPKQVYQTMENAVLGATQTAVDVKVRAVNRGEGQDTASETVVVMPRPVPGIKEVLNREAIRLTGKRRETDEELRARAKNALISSGKATILSIENALLSMPGIRDAKVRENFHFARGKVKISRTTNTGLEVTFPKGTLLKHNINGDYFKTLDPLTFLTIDNVGTEKEVMVEALKEGKLGEIADLAMVSLDFDDSAFAPDFSISPLSPIVLSDFGVIEVYVDSARLEEGDAQAQAAEMDRIQTEIDRVRSAGIFTLLRPVGAVEFNMVVKVELDESANLSPEERREFEEILEEIIEGMLAKLRMGDRFLFGQLVKEVLGQEGVSNVLDFKGTAVRELSNQNLATTFNYSDDVKQVNVDEYERIKPRFISVASEDKPLPINLEFLVDITDAALVDQLKAGLEAFFSGLPLGQTFLKSTVEAEIATVLGTLAGPPSWTAASLHIKPQTWSPGRADDLRPVVKAQNADEVVLVTFVEQPVMGDLFAYNSNLDITGALKLTLPLNVPAAQQESIISECRSLLDAYIDNLSAEDDVEMAQLTEIASGVDGVLAVDLNEDDFRVYKNGAEEPGRVEAGKIDVAELEKSRLQDFIVTTGVEVIRVSATLIEVLVQDPAASASQVTNLEALIQSGFNNALAGAEAGSTVLFSALRSAIENLDPQLPYTITTLDLAATSDGDGRIQNSDLVSNLDFHIRSVELPVVTPLDLNNLNVTITS